MNRSRSTSGTWRERWAYQENGRRGKSYAAVLGAWQRRDDRLRAMRDAAAMFDGSPDDGSLPVTLRHDERVLLTLAGVWPVDAPYVEWLPPPAVDSVPLAVPTGDAAPGIHVGHAGAVLITDRRLVFAGPGQSREWAYGKISGLSHDPAAPMTLIQVVDRPRASGLLVLPAVVETFRFHLQLGIADAAGERAALVAHIDELVREHDGRRPVQPLAVEPIDAPLRARWSPLAVVTVTVVVLVVLCGVGALVANAGT
jgi:hypothetical protein